MADRERAHSWPADYLARCRPQFLPPSAINESAVPLLKIRSAIKKGTLTVSEWLTKPLQARCRNYARARPAPHGQKPSRSSKLECPPRVIYLTTPAQFLKYFAFDLGSRGTYERSSYRRDSDRHRRLDLRAMAGGVLPRQTAAET